jgi:hypothetical protein
LVAGGGFTDYPPFYVYWKMARANAERGVIDDD